MFVGIDSGPEGETASAGRLDELTAELWHDHRPWLFHLAYSHGAANEADASGMIQDAFLRIVNAVQERGVCFATIGELKGYFRETISSVAVDRARKEQRMPVSLEDGSGETESTRAPPADEPYLAEPLPAPDELLRNREARWKHRQLWRRIHREIQRLSLMQRTVVEHRYLSGKDQVVPFPEIGAKAEITASTARSHHERAIATLRQRLAAWGTREG